MVSVAVSKPSSFMDELSGTCLGSHQEAQLIQQLFFSWSEAFFTQLSLSTLETFLIRHLETKERTGRGIQNQLNDSERKSSSVAVPQP